MGTADTADAGDVAETADAADAEDVTGTVAAATRRATRACGTTGRGRADVRGRNHERRIDPLISDVPAVSGTSADRAGGPVEGIRPRGGDEREGRAGRG
ncbi:hypothetical protein GCM10017559_66850 [Streptosporangium longisporum]|uniref:Uncharacterized protein n=1 Tax=Streptosporangium longisporum TaxID=46187 RepID=A0ABP6L2V4_9ACTN